MSSSKSYAEYDRERLNTFFVSKKTAKQNLEKRFKDELCKRRKPRTSIGKFSNYNFDKDKFLEELKSIKSGTKISWTEFARKYSVKNNQGKTPGNAGQVLFQYARSNGIDVFQFNKHQRISGCDYFQRVRTKKKDKAINPSM